MKRASGFTLLELMIIVVIIGILATVAIPTFTGYIYRSRVTEATTFLSEIKQRQESYRDEFGRYADVSSSITDFHPTSTPGADPVMWENDAEWTQLGAQPDGPIRFRYCTVAGLPGDTPPTGSNMDDDDHWFMARARGDLDEDGTTFDLEMYSQSNHLYNSASGMGGWE